MLDHRCLITKANFRKHFGAKIFKNLISDVSESRPIFRAAFALKKVLKDFKEAFGKAYILKWSLWWALAMCGNFQVTIDWRKLIMFKESNGCFLNMSELK